MGGTLARIAWRNIWRNRRRTLLTALAIAFGIGLIVITRGLQAGSYAQMIDVAVRRSPGHIQVHAQGYWEKKDLAHTFPIAAVDTAGIAHIPGVAHVSPKLVVDALASVGEENSTGAQVVGVIPSLERAMTVFGDSGIMEPGRFLTDGDTMGAVIGTTMARNLHARVGDELVLFTQARDGSVAAALVHVRGIFHVGELDMDGYLVMANLALMQNILVAPGRASIIALTVKDVRDVDRVRAEIEGLLATRGGSARWQVMTYRRLMPDIMQSIAFDHASGIIFLILLLVVIAFGILDTILMSVMERFHEFGVMMALGMRGRAIAAMVFVEGLLLAVIGLAVGNAIGWAANAWWQQHPTPLGGAAEAMESVGFHPELIALPDLGQQATWSVVVLCMTLAVALWPAVVAARFRPVEAIRQT